MANEIPEIARGASGQTTLIRISGTPYPSSQNVPYQWQIQDEYGTVAYGSNDNPNGWDFVEGGNVIVPLGSESRLYKALRFQGPLDYFEEYHFQVVCMTAKVTVVETYRDEDKYRLSCTATPQGGTAPYTYNWSNTVNGSQALSALNQATLEVEIPAIGVGTISVAVSDGSTPPCTASASFDVCGNMVCEFTTALFSIPPVGQTGPYI